MILRATVLRELCATQNQLWRFRRNLSSNAVIKQHLRNRAISPFTRTNVGLTRIILFGFAMFARCSYSHCTVRVRAFVCDELPEVAVTVTV